MITMKLGERMSLEQKERVKRGAKEREARPEVNEKRRNIAKEQWASPKAREEKSKVTKEIWDRPDFRKRMSVASIKREARPEVKIKRKEIAEENWSNPKIRNKIIKSSKEALAKPEIKEKIKAVRKEQWAVPGVRDKITGPNNSRWRGGISFEPYCPKFNNRTKEDIRKAFGYKCYLCPHIQKKKKLSIHHVDYNKNTICNGKRWPLIPLCLRCHSKTNFNRWFWFNLLINYWAMNPEINFNRYEVVC
jgi:hypothetical protein